MNKYLNHLIDLVASKITERINPKLFTISKVNIEPGDVIFLRSHVAISDEGTERLLQTIKNAIPQISKVFLLEEGLELGVLHADAFVVGKTE